MTRPGCGMDATGAGSCRRRGRRVSRGASAGLACLSGSGGRPAEHPIWCGFGRKTPGRRATKKRPKNLSGLGYLCFVTDPDLKPPSKCRPDLFAGCGGRLSRRRRGNGCSSGLRPSRVRRAGPPSCIRRLWPRTRPYCPQRARLALRPGSEKVIAHRTRGPSRWLSVASGRRGCRGPRVSQTTPTVGLNTTAAMLGTRGSLAVVRALIRGVHAGRRRARRTQRDGVPPRQLRGFT